MASTRYTGADATPRGWILHDTRISVENLSATHSSYTEAAPRAAGTGDPSTIDTAAVVELSGDQDQTIVVEALSGGLPVLGSGFQAGYRLATDAAADLAGWQDATHVTGVSCPAFGITAIRDLTAVTLVDGRILQGQRATVGGTLSFRLYDPSTNTWTAVAPVFPGAPSSFRGPGLALSVDQLGRALILFRSTATGPYEWLLYRSSDPDDNNSWELIARPATLIALIPDNPARLRLFAMRSGDLALVVVDATTPTGSIKQLASADGGATWREVSSLGNSTTNLSEATQAADGSIVVFRLDASNDLKVYRTGSAWVGATSLPTVYEFLGNDVEIWAWSDPAGRLYYASRGNIGARRPLWVNWSDNYGASWDSNGLVFSTDLDIDCYPTRGQACYSLGYSFILHQSESPGVTTDDSPILVRLGGWQNCVFTSFSSGGAGSVTGASWWPIGEPDDLACWSAVGSDADDTIDATGGLVINTAATRYYTHAPTLTTSIGAHIWEYELSMVSGTADVYSRLSDGVSGSVVQVSHTTTQIEIFENGVSLGTYPMDLTTPMQFRVLHRRAVTLATGYLEVFYRRPSSLKWTRAEYSGILAAGPTTVTAFWGAPFSAANVRFGFIWSLGINESQCPAQFYGSRRSAQSEAEDALPGKPLTGLPTPLATVAATTVGTGRRVAYLRGGDGPAAIGDAWDLRPAYEYPIEALHPLTEPSPRRSWRSTADNVIANIAWSLGTGPGSWLSNYVGVAVFGTNVETINVQALVSAVWTTIGTITTTQGFSGLAWSRSGRVVRPNGSPAGGRYIFRGELVGSYFDFGGGNIGRIVRHTEGIWSTAAGRGVEIEVDTVGAAGASGSTGAIRVANAVRIFRTTHTKPWEAIRLNIPAQQAYGDCYEIGTLVLGQVVAAGQSHAWGSTQTYNRNAADAVSGDGVPSTRSLGPVVRSWEWSWSDGTDQSRLLDASPTPDYIAFAAVSDGVANVNDAPYLVAGLLEDSASGEVPIVACDYMQDQTTITDRRLFMLGRIMGSVGVEHVQGDPESDSVLRVSPVSMREIV